MARKKRLKLNRSETIRQEKSKAEDMAQAIVKDAEKIDFGGWPVMDFKKNLGCG